MLAKSIVQSAVVAAMLLFAQRSCAEGPSTQLAEKDFAFQQGAVEYKGQKVLLVSKEHSENLGGIDVRNIEVNEKAKFTVEVEAAGADGEKFSLRALPLVSKGEKLPAVWAGVVKQKVSADFKTYKGEFSVPNDEGKKVTSLMILALRFQPKGDVWVKSVKLSVRSVSPAKADARLLELKKTLAAEGFQLTEQGGVLTASKPTERRYYSLRIEGVFDDLGAFVKAACLGITVARADFAPPLFPMGPYIYGTPKELEERARARRMTLQELLEAHAKDVAAHGGNTIYYANLAGEPDAFIMAVNAATKHRISVFAQLPGPMYLNPAKGREYYERVTKPAAQNILPRYKGLEGVLGWMGKEEASVKEMPLVIEYRKLCKELDPTHNLFTLNNRLEGFQADTEAYAEWYGFDRYRFKIVQPPGVISTPREVVSLLSNEIAGCYAEAAKRGRPLICVGQAWAFIAEKTTKMEPRSGFREVRPGVWRGWERYLPEHAMYLQSWLAITEGAKGLLWYHYYGATQGRDTAVGKLIREECLVDENGTESPHWQELGQCFYDLQRLTPLFLSWFKEGLRYGTADSPWIKIRTFIRDFDHERYYVLLNTRIAEWDNTSPSRPTNDTNLHFDEKGVAGFDPVGDLEFKFTPEGGDAVWDVLTAKRLISNADGSFTLKLPPGRGIVLVQGSEKDVSAALERVRVAK